MASALAMACGSPVGPSSTPFEPDRLSFQLDRTAYAYTNPPDYVSSGITDNRLTIGVDDYNKQVSLALALHYGGPGTYKLGEAADDNTGRLVIDGTTYTTAADVVSGSVSVASESCNTTSGEDFATGIYGTFTFCRLVGTFEFNARAPSGELATLSDGRFQLTTQRY